MNKNLKIILVSFLLIGNSLHAFDPKEWLPTFIGAGKVVINGIKNQWLSALAVGISSAYIAKETINKRKARKIKETRRKEKEREKIALVECIENTNKQVEDLRNNFKLEKQSFFKDQLNQIEERVIHTQNVFPALDELKSTVRSLRGTVEQHQAEITGIKDETKALSDVTFALDSRISDLECERRVIQAVAHEAVKGGIVAVNEARELVATVNNKIGEIYMMGQSAKNVMDNYNVFKELYGKQLEILRERLEKKQDAINDELHCFRKVVNKEAFLVISSEEDNQQSTQNISTPHLSDLKKQINTVRGDTSILYSKVRQIEELLEREKADRIEGDRKTHNRAAQILQDTHSSLSQFDDKIKKWVEVIRE